ncbi:hypothetical protein [Moraxella lacunata]|uniref:hypothetical protein n=1 Tax=Moraxella lacunata TaxID=477 RepID=UPI003EE3487E
MGGKGTIIAYGSGILEKYGSLICGLFFFKLPKLPNYQIVKLLTLSISYSCLFCIQPT